MEKVKKFFSKSDTDIIKTYDAKKGITLDKYDILYVPDALSFNEMFDLLAKETSKVVFRMEEVDYIKLVDAVHEHRYKYIDGYKYKTTYLVYISK